MSMEREFTITELQDIAAGTAQYTTLTAFARSHTNGNRKAAVIVAAKLVSDYEDVRALMRSYGHHEVRPGLWVDYDTGLPFSDDEDEAD